MARNDLVLTLTRDELLALLQLVGASTMNGLPENPFDGVAEKERAERLNAGLETLINRGLVTVSGSDSVLLDDTLVALVGSCILPGASLVVSGLQPDGSADPHFFNATPDILVEHSSPRLGVHSFAYLPDVTALGTRLATVLTPITASTDRSDFHGLWPDALVAEVFRLARSQRQAAAVQNLVKAKWPTAQAEAFVAACAGWAIYTALCAWGLRGEQVEGSDTVVIVSDQQRCWLLEPQGATGDVLKVSAVTGQGAVDAVVGLAQHLASATDNRP